MVWSIYNLSYRLASGDFISAKDCLFTIGSKVTIPGLPHPQAHTNPSRADNLNPFDKFFKKFKKGTNYDPLGMAKYDRDPIFKTYSIQEDYEIKWHRNLGAGISGPVRMCINKKNGKEYALKILLDRPKAHKEVTLHWLCSGSDHVVRAIDVYANEVILPGESVAKKRILLVMELMSGGELFEFITKKQHFTEKEASQIMHQIALAVQYCHKRSIAHRDLKPENLLLVEKVERTEELVVKLADFGFAKVDNGDLTTPQFTPYYVAPQVLEAQKRQKEIRQGHRSPTSPYYYDKSCDMWSIGVILYIMLCGYPPFYSEVPNQPITARMRKRIMSGEFDFPQNEWKGTSDSAKDLIRHLLCVEASERITVEDILHHPWLVSGSVPSNNLPSPSIMMDTEQLEQAKAFHSEFLQDMRREEEGFYLKPIGKSKNKLLSNRQRNGLSPDPMVGPTTDGSRPDSNQRPVVDEGVKSLLELRDICIMPPPLVTGATESFADSTLVEGVRKAITFNEDHSGLLNLLITETWDVREHVFVGLVNRQRLADSIQNIIGPTPTIDSPTIVVSTQT